MELPDRNATYNAKLAHDNKAFTRSERDLAGGGYSAATPPPTTTAASDVSRRKANEAGVAASLGATTTVVKRAAPAPSAHGPALDHPTT